MKLTRALVACSAVLAATVSVLPAQTLTSIDFNALEGTSWADVINTPLRLNFGDLGMGTVTITSVNGGSFGYIPGGAPFPYNSPPYSTYSDPTTLSNGSIFSPTEEVVFTILPSFEEGLSGFTMTVTLDEGNFTDGSVFSVRSLAYSGTDSQYFQPVEGIGQPDPTQLPSDGSDNPDLVLADAGLNLYAPSPTAESEHGASSGLAFVINGGNSFTVNLLTSSGYEPGAVAFTIATAPIPEPSAVLSGVASIGFLCMVRRRR